MQKLTKFIENIYGIYISGCDLAVVEQAKA